MKKIIAFIIAAILEAIIIGLIVRETSYELAVLTLLVQILCKMLVGELDER